LTLPDDFVLGAATSAFQIEGGRSDGKGQSIWDTFSDQGRMQNPGDVACDHYHRWPEDVALMKALGLDAYRFSVAWTRVLPEGTGHVNQAGLDFYQRLIEGLLEAGITPWLTLYHWDLPQALADRGGWVNRQTIEAFVEYTDLLAATFGDRVEHWITHNEPWVATVLGHIEGVFAPGLTDWSDGLRAGHHLLVSHGRAVAALRERVPRAEVGIALDCRPADPDVPAQLRPAWRHFDGYRNRWFFDPVFGLGYPDDMLRAYRRRGRRVDFIEPGDLEVIAVPIDFLGLNYYTSVQVRAGAEESEDSPVKAGPNPPSGYTEMGWKITPKALTDFLGRVHRQYQPARIIVTENGASYSDGPGSDGRVRDQRRIDYLKSHLEAVELAIEAGVPVGGYFVWSLLDNLEWTAGFSQRFGLVHVDHATQKRTPKDSFEWYRNVIKTRKLD
jgi:beta-glucosidase